jgi:hypothetical protein
MAKRVPLLRRRSGKKVFLGLLQLCVSSKYWKSRWNQLSFAEEIIKQRNKSSSLSSVTNNDPLQRQPDITKAKDLGWEAKIGRAEGMKITYDYFKSLSKEELSKKEHKIFLIILSRTI